MRINGVPGAINLDWSNNRLTVRDAQDNVVGGVGTASPSPAANSGQFVANGATNVTVTDPNIQTGDIVVFGLQTIGGTVGNTPTVKSITNGVSFLVACTAADTSTYNYRILKTF